MKTITAILILGVFFTWAYTFVGNFAVKQDYHHCMMMNQDSLANALGFESTDAQIVDTVRKCELTTGYTLDEELLP